MQILLDAAQRILYIAAGIGGISALIFFHEMGHFLFCKLFGIYTPSFSIGFGPTLASKKIWDTNFVIAAIPLGGYVEIAGLAEVGQGDQEHAQTKGARSFNEKPYYQKALVLLGGIAFNLIFAYAALVGIHATGFSANSMLYIESANTTIAKITPNSIADESALKAGDVLQTINGISLDGSIEAIPQVVRAAGDSIEVTVLRQGRTRALTIDLSAKQRRPAFLGITFETTDQQPAGLTEALKRGIATTNRWIKNTAMAYLNLFKKRDMSTMGGPIKIISMITQSAADGFVAFLLFLAIISVNLAIFNVIPVPILDGGQLLICTVEALMQRTLPEKTREYLFMGTWLVFLVLVIYLSFYDIKDLLMPYIGKLWTA